MAKLRIAVIGAGLIGMKHVELLARDGTLAAVVDPTEAGPAAAARFGCAHFADVETCLAAMTPDGAVVATPNHTHVPLAQVLVGAGVPVLIEKPIADASGTAKELVEFAKARAVALLVGHHRRHNPLIKAAKEVIEGGQLGRLTMIDAKFWLYKPDGYFDQTWRTKAGAGPVFINLIHDIDILRHLCGDIVDVQSFRSNGARGHEVEDTTAAILRFENGALGTVSVSDTTVAPWSWEFTAGENPAYPHVPGAAYKIGGTEASLSVPDLVMWRHSGEKSWWAPIEQTRVPFDETDPLNAQINHFYEVIEGRADPLVSGEEATKSLEVIEAIMRGAG